jgi:outer membrane protein assembly factor BamC
VLDTGWFILESNVLTKEKMRVSVEPGFQNDSAEIRLLHVSAAQAIPTIGQVNWPESSNDPEVEFDFLSDLSNYLADVADLYQASSVSFLAENIDSQGKASLVSTPGGKELLRLEADYERSWAAIGRALERAGVEVVAESVELGVYEVDYVINNNDDEEDEPGFFKKVVTLYGLLDRGEPQRFYPLKIQLLELNGEVEVLVESLELLPQPTGGFSEAENSLLRLIRNNIA